MNLSDIKIKSFPGSKRHVEKKVSLWMYFIIRPASFYPTCLAYNLNISANQATLFGFFCGMTSIMMAYQGYMFLAALFLNIFAIIDCVDGNLARLRESTKVGEYLDAVSGDIIYYTFLPIFLYSAFRDGNLNHLEEISPVPIMSIIVAIAFIQLLSGMANQRLKVIFNKDAVDEEIKSPSIFELLLRNGYGVAFLFPSSLLVSTFNYYDILLLYMTISAPAYYVISILRAIKYKDNAA